MDFSELFEAVCEPEEWEEAQKRLSSFFFGNDSFSWDSIIIEHQRLESIWSSPYSSSWSRSDASDTLADMDPTDERILKEYIQLHHKK